jgi:pseudaminic acid cytidylyltransferase
MCTKSIAIIPARGGSKRIPRKNIRNFCGQPIIKYSIDSALKAGCFDEVMVSTDDSEIAKIATCCGAKAPFMRSEVNSNDYATIADVVREVLLKYESLGEHYEYVCCIYATAPFVSSDRLNQGMELLKRKNADSVVAVTPYSKPVMRSLKIENECLTMLFPENYSKRSQDLDTIYYDSGQFYCMKSRSLLDQMKLFAEYTVPIVVKQSEAQDIDDEEDWIKAEIKYKKVLEQQNIKK